jgi:hypothetical protein
MTRRIWALDSCGGDPDEAAVASTALIDMEAHYRRHRARALAVVDSDCGRGPMPLSVSFFVR